MANSTRLKSKERWTKYSGDAAKAPEMIPVLWSVTNLVTNLPRPAQWGCHGPVPPALCTQLPVGCTATTLTNTACDCHTQEAIILSYLEVITSPALRKLPCLSIEKPLWSNTCTTKTPSQLHPHTHSHTRFSHQLNTRFPMIESQMS